VAWPVRRLPLLLALLALVVGCGQAAPPAPAPAPAALRHEAYVWQRAWTGAVGASVATASPALAGLRVLTAEVDAAGAVTWPAVDTGALARTGRPVTAVVRLDGARPPGALDGAPAAPLAAALDRIAAWQRAGVDVTGLEIDHDCATAALPAYARWLAAARPPAPLRWSITALPTWASSPALADVAAAVDELVVQVHAVAAPRLFDRGAARRWLDEVAAALPTARLRVALPTYQVEVGGERLAADPVEVAALVRDLERRPIANLAGVVWFRLPTAGDSAAWPAPTLDAVIAGAPLVARVEARLVARGPALYDVVVANPGTLAGAWPTLHLTGALTAADLVAGYAPTRDHTWTPPHRALPAGAETVVGWATGKDLRLDVF